MASQNTEGAGHGSAEGPIRQLSLLPKVDLHEESLPAFDMDDETIQNSLVIPSTSTDNQWTGKQSFDEYVLGRSASTCECHNQGRFQRPNFRQMA